MSTVRLDASGIDLDQTLRVLGMLPRDPSLRLSPGRLARACVTPDGPGVLQAHWQPGEPLVDVATFGPGAAWLTSQAPALLGITDHGAGEFATTHPAVCALRRRLAGARVPRTGTVWHDLCWFVVQQRVRRAEAAGQWRRLVERFGTEAPDHPDLAVPPTPEQMIRIPGHELRACGLDGRRANTLRVAARHLAPVSDRLEWHLDDAQRRVASIPGVGPWTLSMLAAITGGEPDTLIVGDSGIPALVGWAVARQRGVDDDALRTLLEPFRPHRYRVIQLAFLSGDRPPRRSPRGDGAPWGR